MSVLSQRTFARGELAPALHSRVDLEAYHLGLRTMRNFMTRRDGGADNRPGTKFVAEVKDSSKKVRLVPFVFNDEQTFVLEFGQGYIRFHRNGSQIRETGKAITGITAADPAVASSVAHGFSANDTVYISGVLGMTEVNGRWFRISNPASDTFELKEMDGEDVNAGSYTAYTSGGNAQRVYEIGTPYQEDELMDLDIKQSADIYVITHQKHAPRKLVRTDDFSWALSVLSLTPSISAPTGLSAGAGSGSFWVVTAVKEETFEESYASAADEGATPSIATPTNLTWTNQTDAVEYNVYRRKNGVYGHIGVARWDGSGTVDFSDTNLPVDVSITPPESRASVDGFDTTFTKLTDPASLPAGNGQGSSWSPDGRFYAVAHTTTPFITIYERSGTTFTKLTDPASLPAGNATGCAFSPDGRFLAVSHATSPFVTIYQINGNLFTKLSNPASLPAGQGNGVAWSPDSKFLAVAHNTTPFCTVYSVFGTTFTKMASGDTSQFTNSASLPTGNGNGVSWHMYQTEAVGGFAAQTAYLLAVAHDTSPYISVYYRTISAPTVFSKIGNPGTLPAGNGQGCAFSPSGQFLVVAHTTTPFSTFYELTITTLFPIVSFSKLTNPATLPTGNAEGVSWSPNGFFICVNHATTPFSTIYEMIGKVPAKLDDPATLPAAQGNGSSFSPDTKYLGIAHTTTPFTSIYEIDTLHPAVCFFYQQRLGFAATIDDPERFWASRTSNFQNFSQSFPIQTDDSFNFRLPGRSIVSEIRHGLDLGRLVFLTSEAEVLLKGDEQGALTPFAVNPRFQSYNGAAKNPKPVIIDNTAIYCQARSSILRDLAFDYEFDGYRGNDLTRFATHLTEGHTLLDMAYQTNPHSILWVVRDDGKLLGLTYVKDERILAWHHHDTIGENGSAWKDAQFERVCVVPEGNEDALYVVVKRWVDTRVIIAGVVMSGSVREVRSIERFALRHPTDYRDYHFTDNGYVYDGRNTTPITMALSGGTQWDDTETLTLTASEDYFESGDVGDAIHLYYTDENGVTQEIRCLITVYTSSTVVSVTVHQKVTTAMDLRSTATEKWAHAVDQLTGLWHLGTSEVSVYADGYVVASPNNYVLDKKTGLKVRAYDAIEVANGAITLPRPYAVIHVGLPYYSDLETLDVDMPGRTLVGIQKKVTRTFVRVLNSLRAWFGAKVPPNKPSNLTAEPLKDMAKQDTIVLENSTSPMELVNDVVNSPVPGEWNGNGRVFSRQPDPVPTTILSVHPEGIFS